MSKNEVIYWLNWCKDNDYLNAPIKWDVKEAARIAIDAVNAQMKEDENE